MSSLLPRLSLTFPAIAALRYRSIHSSPARWSGHNRWSKIRHAKGAADSKRSAMFSKIGNEITTAVKLGGGNTNPETNARLAQALAKAKQGNMPKDNIATALKRGEAGGPGSNAQTVTYEAMAPGGEVGMIIECLTDNPARTNHLIKEYLSKYGARAASTAYLFDRKGVISLTPAPGTGFEEVFELSLEGGAEDVRVRERSDGEEEGEDEGGIEVITPPTLLSPLSLSLSAAQHTLHSIDLAYVPKDGGEGVDVDEERREKIERLAEALEDEAGANGVWTNLTGWGA